MKKCKWCKGYVINLHDEDKCINCGRTVDSVSPHLPLFSIIYRSSRTKSHKGMSYRDYDLERIADVKALERCLEFCIGSGLGGLVLTAKYLGTKGKGSSIDKGECRICSKPDFVTRAGKMVTHKPIDPLAREIRDVLERAGGTATEN